ncbi:hypothetical protein [Streptomyces sp. B6B3]|uniref:hypothetical protein n=1 Tax=Streptomyces sp. B6B3 TaxID=3153570 RepID=UPI00325EFE70
MKTGKVGIFIATSLLFVLVSGCSVVDGSQQGEEPDGQHTVQSVDEARAEDADIAASIREAAGIGGSVDDPGVGVSMCEDDPEMNRLYLMRHPWSIHGVSRDRLEEGMDRLRETLPSRGWEIIQDGEVDNANRTPRILFENRELEYAAHVTVEGRGEGFQLHVSMVSACFSTPEGESPRNEY